MAERTTEKKQVVARVALILGATLALLVGYYWVHKPAGLEIAFTLGGALLDLLAAGAVIAVGGGLGRRVLARLLPLGPLSSGERLALEASIGLGLLSSAALGLGLVGLYTPAALWALLIAAAALGRSGLRDWLADAQALVRGGWPAEAWPRFLAAFTLAALALALLHALAPPIAWDALMYHLDGPRSYLDAGRIVARPDNPYLGFPQGVETLYGLSMALFGRDTAAAPLHFGLGLLALLSLGGLAWRHSGAAAGWLTAALVMSGYSAWLLFGWPYVDLGVLLYSAVALTAFVSWCVALDDRWLFLAGVSAGLSLGVKYTAGALLLALFGSAAWVAPRRIVRSGLLLGLPALLLFLPWLARGLLLYHNPVYPFFFGGLGWDAVRNDLFFGGAGLVGRGAGWQVLILPAAAAIFGVEKAPGFAFTAGPWLLTLPLLVPLGWRWLDTPARALAAACWTLLAPLLLIWAALAAFTLLGAQTRLMMPALAVSAAAGALALEGLARWPQKPVSLYPVLRGIVGFTLVLALAEMVYVTARAGPAAYLTAAVDRAAYLDGRLGVYARAMRQLAELSPRTRVRFLWEPQGYYCPAHLTCVPDSLLDAWPHPVRAGQPPDDVFASWRAAGDDYLLVFDVGRRFLTEVETRAAPENRQFAAAAARWLELVWQDDAGAYSLYAWRATP